ncbi:MAG: nucleoside 2-deoxyribosyltransferase [bacterium]|nr:nucleoside 2-deoxyribosyltransferase [bacterium]
MSEKRQNLPERRRAQADGLIYLAGPITGLSFEEVVYWRKVVNDVMPAYIETASPLRGKDEYLTGVERMAESYDHIDRPMSSGDGLFLRDTFDVRRCTLVLANLTGTEVASIGTIAELGIAWERQTPIIVAAEPDSIHGRHPFIKKMAGMIFPTLKEATGFAVKTISTGKVVPLEWPEDFDAVVSSFRGK